MCGSVAICSLLLLAKRHPDLPSANRNQDTTYRWVSPTVDLHQRAAGGNWLLIGINIGAHQTAAETQTSPDVVSVESAMLYAYGSHSMDVGSHGNVPWCSPASLWLPWELHPLRGSWAPWGASQRRLEALNEFSDVSWGYFMKQRWINMWRTSIKVKHTPTFLKVDVQQVFSDCSRSVGTLLCHLLHKFQWKLHITAVKISL